MGLAVPARLTVPRLSVVLTGIGWSRSLVPGHDGDGLWWPLVPTLLLAGLGGGGVVSPNFTLTLAEVPPRMGGAAGGALQTGQRIGSALGAALLMTAYQLGGLRASLLTAVAVLSLAMAAALLSLRSPVSASEDGAG